MVTITNKPQALDQIPCTALKGVGKQLAEKLQKRGIENVQDLLFHLPLRYQDRTRISPIRSLRPGDYGVIQGTITSVKLNYGRKVSMLCHISDGSGQIGLRFFHFTAQQKERLQVGTRLRCFAEVRYGMRGLELIHPEYRFVFDDSPQTMEEHLTPIYPTTEGLSQQMLRKLTDQALALLEDQGSLAEYLPEEFCQNMPQSSLREAVLYVHRPPPDADQNLLEQGEHPAQQRLAFEELLAHHLTLRRLRYAQRKHKAPVLKSKQNITKKFLKKLPFKLTNAQQRVYQDILQDVQQAQPMGRMVQGDVGSGKTVVAALAMLQAVECDLQAVLMAPTEILAEQHYLNFSNWFEPLGLKVAWLAGRLGAKARREALELIQQGEAQIIIGTHALFQKEVEFANLGLLVIDEQHRFGVEQRLALREKGVKNNCYPHQLIMTATPIPRTLSMVTYADLDTSIIDELPPGRTPVTTVALPNKRRDDIVERIRENCQHKRQAYWVCSLVEESEVLQCQAAEATAVELTKNLPECQIGLVHGRMKTKEKEAVMTAFKQGDYDVLVATTVIEVGVDVPNASLMVIENPERLGLAQLHQLRGRVGRGVAKSHCVLLYKRPLSEQARERIAVLRATNDGFEIARKDLQLRGPGEVLGTRQTGSVRFRIADLMRDRKLLPAIQQTAETLLKNYHDRVELIIKRWILPQGEQCGEV